MLNFLTANGLDYYNSQVKKIRNSTKLTACTQFLKELRISAEYKYNAKWNALMLTDANSIADCCLELLGDRLYSRFFTRYTGEISCTPAQILLAYTALERFKQAQNNVDNEVQSTYDTYLLTDIAMAMPDDDASEQLECLYAYAVWYALFSPDIDSVYTQLKTAVTWNDVKIPQYLVPIFVPYFTSTKNGKAVGVYDPRGELIHAVNETLLTYIDNPELKYTANERDLFYVGVDMKQLPALTYACLNNTPLYYNGHLQQIMRSFSTLDTKNLITEVKDVQSNSAGLFLQTLMKEDNTAKLLYANNGLIVFTYNTAEISVPVAAIPEFKLDAVFDINATTRVLFRTYT